MAVDGSITINTKLETGDAEKDLVALHGSIKKAASAMESIGRSSQRAFESARLKVDETKLALERLEQKEREIQAQKIQEFSHMPFSRNQLHEAVEASLASDKEYQKLQGQIERTILKLDQYTLRMERAKETSDSASASLERLRDSMSETGKEAVKTGASTQKATKDMKKMKDATIPLSKSLLTVGRVFKLMLLRMVIRATIQAVRQGFRDLAQYSAEFNRSMSALSTATLQARNSLTTTFAPALQAITPMILNAVNALVSLFNMMGMLSARVFGNATTFTKAKKAQVDYAKSVAGTNKAVKEQLAAFDELNVLAKDQGQGAEAGVPTPADMFEEVEIPENVMTLGDTLRSAFEGLVSMLGPAKQALQELWGELQRLGGFAWEGLKDFYELFLKPVGDWVMGEGLPRFIDALTDGLSQVDWGKINGSLRNLWAALAPFTIKVGEGLLWFWENVLKPLGTWTMNEIVPRFLDLLAASARVLDSALDALRPLGEWLWENFLKPIAEWTGGKILDILDILIENLEKISDWIDENQKTIETLAIIVGSFAAAWGLVNLAIGIWNVIGVVATAVTSAFGAAVAFLTSPIGIVIIAIGALIAIIVLLMKNWEKVKEVAAKVWDGVKAIWSVVAQWFTDNVVNPVSDAFNSLKDNVIESWSKIWNGIKGFINLIIDGIEWMINKIIDAFNWLFEKLNSVKIKVPKVFGGGNIGFNIGLWDNVALPRLATGAVIPPNAEFLAILGDQKHGRNIEAPEGLIRQIMREEMEGMGGSQEITIRFEGTMSQFVRSLKPYVDQENRRVGKALIQGV